ncbi:MAG: DUF2141 domain-containing protein [Flavobacteriaceae bacterium]
MVKLVLAAALTLGSLIGHSQNENRTFNLVANVNNIESNKGTMYYALYVSAESMMNREAIQRQTAKINEGASTITFKNVEVGEYSIVVYHDLNNNKQMDFNEMGMPLEKYGVSNNKINPYGPPSFSDTKFEVKDTNLTFEIELY